MTFFLCAANGIEECCAKAWIGHMCAIGWHRRLLAQGYVSVIQFSSVCTVCIACARKKKTWPLQCKEGRISISIHGVGNISV